MKFSIETVVRVELHQSNPPNRNGLIARFLAWSKGAGIAAFSHQSGLDWYIGFYRPRDAGEIRAWLEQQKAVDGG